MTDQGQMQPEVIRLLLEPCCLEILLIVRILADTILTNSL